MALPEGIWRRVVLQAESSIQILPFGVHPDLEKMHEITIIH